MSKIYDEALEILEKRTKIGTMSRDYGHTVDDILHIENSYELTVIENALQHAKKQGELLVVVEAERVLAHNELNRLREIDDDDIAFGMMNVYFIEIARANERLKVIDLLITLIGRFYENLESGK